MDGIYDSGLNTRSAQWINKKKKTNPNLPMLKKIVSFIIAFKRIHLKNRSYMVFAYTAYITHTYTHAHFKQNLTFYLTFFILNIQHETQNLIKWQFSCKQLWTCNEAMNPSFPWQQVSFNIEINAQCRNL